MAGDYGFAAGTGSAALRDYSNMGRKYNNADPARGAGLSAAVEPAA